LKESLENSVFDGFLGIGSFDAQLEDNVAQLEKALKLL
jgi:hypothetical protein